MSIECEGFLQEGHLAGLEPELNPWIAGVAAQKCADVRKARFNYALRKHGGGGRRFPGEAV
jgi:hypothetical protein